MNGAAEDGSSPYVPVDPFKPSIAFSLNNVMPQRQPRHNRVAQPSSLHQPPQRAHLPGRRGPYQRGRYGYGHGHYQRPAPFPYPYPYPPNVEVNYHAPGPIYPERRYEASRSPQLRGRSPTRRVVEEERADGTSARSQSSPGSHRPVYLPPTHTGIIEPILDSRLPPVSPPVESPVIPIVAPSQPLPTTIISPSPLEAQLPLEASPLPHVALPLSQHRSPPTVLVRQRSESSESVVEIRPQLPNRDHAVHHSHAQQEFDIRRPAVYPAPVITPLPAEQPVVIIHHPQGSLRYGSPQYTPHPTPAVEVSGKSRWTLPSFSFFSRKRHQRSDTNPDIEGAVIPGSYPPHSRSGSRSPSPVSRRSRIRPLQPPASYPSHRSRSRARSRSPSPFPQVKKTATKTNDYVVEVGSFGSQNRARRSPERHGTPPPQRSWSPARDPPVVVHGRHSGLSHRPEPPLRARRSQSVVRPYTPPILLASSTSDMVHVEYSGPVEVEPPAPEATTASIKAYITAFLFDVVPRQLYLYMLLRLPSLYYSRVTRIFEEAQMSMPMIKQGILDAAKTKAEGGYYDVPMPVPMGPSLGVGQNGWVEDKKGPGNGAAVMSHPYLPWAYWEPPPESVAYSHLQNTWEAFIDSLQREWKTLNIISVLLLSAILTILQIPAAAADPLTRYAALLSMICALMSLLHGCIYIIRFGTMRKTYKGAEWAEEAQKSRTGIFWNVWVMLAMPATWLAWSMILYIVTIMSFVWRTTPFSEPSVVEETSAQILIPRIIISLVVALGLVYFFLIAATLRKYGDIMDRAWQRRIWGWMKDGVGAAGASDDRDQGDAWGYGYDSNTFGDRRRRRRVYSWDTRSERPNPQESKRETDGYVRRGFEQSGSRHSPARKASSGFLNDDGNGSYFNTNAVEVDRPRPPSVRSIGSQPTRLSAFVGIPSADINASIAHQPFPDNVQNAEPIEAKSVISVESSLPRKLANDPDDILRKPSLTVDVQNIKNMRSSTKSKDNGSPSGSRREDHDKDPFSGSSASPGLDVDLVVPSNSGLNKTRDTSTEGVESITDNPAKIVKMFMLSSESPLDAMSEQDLMECGMDVKRLGPKDLDDFKQNLCRTFSSLSDSSSPAILSSLTPILDKFNQTLHSCNIKGCVAICRELGPSSESSFAAYYFLHFDPFSSPHNSLMERRTFQRYGSIADGLQKLDVLMLNHEEDGSSGMRTISLFPVHPGAQDLKMGPS